MRLARTTESTAIATSIDTGYAGYSNTRDITVLVAASEQERERGIVIEKKFEITRPVYNEIQISGQERRRQRRKQERKK